MRKIWILLISLPIILIYTLINVPIVSAAAPAFDHKCVDKNQVWSPDFQLCIPTDAPGFATAIYQIGLMLISFVAVLFLVIGGYNIMMSRGNVEQLERGKSYVFYSIAGVLLAIFGFVFIEVVTGDILNLPGFGK